MSNSGPGAGDIFDVKKVRRLVEMMEQHDLAEIDLRQGDQRIRLRRGGEVQLAPAAHYSPLPPAAVPQSTTTPGAPPAGGAAPADADLKVITSPMVGTFYAAPSPESPPFVKVGDHIGPETVVCILEAMKVHNQIQAEIAGRVAAVLVENGQPVEYGQPLFKIDTRQ
ncbi:MAG TPA: acetyl-CoA carboxylase biotin carboxyl carrier protein [Pirellulales bacterium]|jgi:acetyl-CoA carboxylase biotin carboxyl carrier protein|nr:acetyl-CoA carboxylase biotin carboxyl carrier protein [Pirellulales bacterium]